MEKYVLFAFFCSILVTVTLSLHYFLPLTILGVRSVVRELNNIQMLISKFALQIELVSALDFNFSFMNAQYKLKLHVHVHKHSFKRLNQH